jgi:hypothetical protein
MALPFNLVSFPVTILTGTALSAAIPTGAGTPVGVAMPAAWTAASMTFQMSADGGATWLEVANPDGTLFVITTPLANSFIQINSNLWMGINNVKIRSGPVGGPVNQLAQRDFFLLTQPQIL